MRKSQKSVLAVMTFGLTMLAAAPAYAIRGEAINLSMIRHQANERAPASKLVRIEGSLTCDYAGGANSGQGCSLRIIENKTGKTFQLIEAQNAMRLFLDGSRNVAIEGSLAGEEAIEVKKAETL
jgi:hypothetical protein